MKVLICCGISLMCGGFGEIINIITPHENLILKIFWCIASSVFLLIGYANRKS